MDTKQLQLVTFGQAKRLKALGFDWECDKLYAGNILVRAGSEDFPLNTDIASIPYSNWNDMDYEWNDGVQPEWVSAPTVALALKWIMDVKKRNFTINLDYAQENGTKNYYYAYKIEYACGVSHSRAFRTFHEPFAYEAAESTLLDELLTVLEKRSGNGNMY